VPANPGRRIRKDERSEFNQERKEAKKGRDTSHWQIDDGKRDDAVVYSLGRYSTTFALVNIKRRYRMPYAAARARTRYSMSISRCSYLVVRYSDS